MGGIVPKAPKVIPWGDDKLLRTKEMAGLKKKDIQKMHDIFAAADEDGGGTISIDEFHTWLNEPKTLFTTRIFELFDCDDDDKELNFSEFCTALTSYCMFGEEEILKFCFVMFDSDRSGYIEGHELDNLIQLLHDTDNVEGNVKTAMTMIDTDGDGRLDFPEFAGMNDKFPQLLFPAFRIQAAMQRISFGDDFWARQRHKQAESRDRFKTKAGRLRMKDLHALQVKRRRALLKQEGWFHGRVSWFAMQNLELKKDDKCRKMEQSSLMKVNKDVLNEILGKKKRKKHKHGHADAEDDDEMNGGSESSKARRSVSAHRTARRRRSVTRSQMRKSGARRHSTIATDAAAATAQHARRASTTGHGGGPSSGSAPGFNPFLDPTADTSRGAVAAAAELNLSPADKRRRDSMGGLDPAQLAAARNAATKTQKATAAATFDRKRGGRRRSA